MYKLILYSICPTCQGTGKNNLIVVEEEDETYGITVDKPIPKSINCFDCADTTPLKKVWVADIEDDMLKIGVDIRLKLEENLISKTP